ncbi:MAG: prolyl oligopeptidase family serine peptidase, partial [Woeseiaceae bacterium]|nr:prolyl oligopeptidase family serine peptidase [Woeseiaceae bacterium]
LVHGRDDTVVPIEQSRKMRNALRRADKDVQFEQIRGEDHWLSSQETRIEVLRIVAEFIEQHL